MASLPGNEEHVRDWLPAYALGSLEESEASAVADHLRVCSGCRQELDAYEQIVAQLALPIRQATPPADLKGRLLRRVEGGRFVAKERPQAPQRSLWRPPRPVWALAALLLCVGLGLGTLLGALWFWQENRPAAVLVEPQGMRAIALNSHDVAPEASAFVVIGADGRNGALVVDKFPPLAPDQTYQLWLERNGEFTSGALFTVDENGYRGARIAAPASLLEYTSIRITIEPADGSPSPTGTMIMDGSLHNR